MARRSTRQPDSFPDPPGDPDGWISYWDSDIILNLPSQEEEQDGDVNYTYRAVYQQLNQFFLPGPGKASVLHGRHPRRDDQGNVTATNIYIYGDVLSLEYPSPPTVNLSTWAHTRHVSLFGRVMTAMTPIELSIPRIGNDSEPLYSFTIWAAHLDQPWRVTYRDADGTETWSQNLELGFETGHLGAKIRRTRGVPVVEYYDSYPADDNPLFEGYLQTELRIATTLFWSHPHMSLSICGFLAKLTANSPEHTQINTQAASLGQQLATRFMLERNLNYVPELDLEQYQDDTQARLDVVDKFNREFERFVDKEASLQNQLDAWDTMLKHAINERGDQLQRRDQALNRYESASEIARNCQDQFQLDDEELANAKKSFEEGVRKWKEEQMRNLFFAMFGMHDAEEQADSEARADLGGAGFISGLANVLAGNLDGLIAIYSATEEIEQIAAAEAEIQPGDMRALGDYMGSLETLLQSIDDLVESAEALDADPEGKMPQIDSVSGSGKGDANAAAIVTVGAWDKWILESDLQMDAAAEIDGASEYQLALRKHHVNGKTLAQAQANAVNAGQEYVQLQMALIVLNRDIENLEKLEETYTGQMEVYQQASEKFYDRQTMLEVGVLIDLLKVAAAFRYYTLKDFKLLPLTNHKSIIQSLKETRKARFTLAPVTRRLANPSDKTNSQGLPQDFHNGYHWRLWGMDPILRGALPRPDKLRNGRVTVNMWIATEGLFSDLDEDGKVHYFSGKRQEKLCSYELGPSGDVNITTSAIYPAEKHLDHTPFTQWTIEIEEETYDALNLDGLEAIDMHYQGKYMPIKGFRRDSGFAP
ncbi:hypothetical protein VTK73DRAFT_7066 [Phialemonium thermophilum]|uniref:Tc toxin complex TcA C-terminal TcB-binding domain-containing protein n=1 Tax=Phialemonium thermophilum TaxID=223376 RepID=A0ABR3WGM7_9PEZI